MSTEFFQFGPDNTEIIALKDFNFASKISVNARIGIFIDLHLTGCRGQQEWTTDESRVIF